MIKIIDSHCHPQYLIKSIADGDIFLQNCFQYLKNLLMVSIIPEDRILLSQLYQKDSRALYSMGIHPSHAHEYSIEEFKHDMVKQKFHAIGECGLDFYHTTEHKKEQLIRFDEQLALAKNLKKPVIIHTRSASQETLNALKNFRGDVRGVIHCFTETKNFAKAVLDLGYFISFSGIITFKNTDDLKDIVKYVPVDRVLVETDAPYLAPAPHRGKENCPQWVTHVLECVALLQKTTYEAAAHQTNTNFEHLFVLNNS